MRGRGREAAGGGVRGTVGAMKEEQILPAGALGEELVAKACVAKRLGLACGRPRTVLAAPRTGGRLASAGWQERPGRRMWEGWAERDRMQTQCPGLARPAGSEGPAKRKLHRMSVSGPQRRLERLSRCRMDLWRLTEKSWILNLAASDSPMGKLFETSPKRQLRITIIRIQRGLAGTKGAGSARSWREAYLPLQVAAESATPKHLTRRPGLQSSTTTGGK